MQTTRCWGEKRANEQGNQQTELKHSAKLVERAVDMSVSIRTALHVRKADLVLSIKVFNRKVKHIRLLWERLPFKVLFSYKIYA